MRQRHVAFIVEQAYGHILPTLGIAMELVKRGDRVSYVVTKDFAPGIARIGARALVFDPVIKRLDIFDSIASNDAKRIEELRRERTENSLHQLERLYGEDKPDVIIHDACEDFAGRLLGLRWGIPQIRFVPVMTNFNDSEFAEDPLILVAVPQFFSRDPAYLNPRVRLIGFIPEGRMQFFEPWEARDDGRKRILVSVTTGLGPQIEFCKGVIGAFRDQPWRVVLSIGALDKVCKITPEDIGDIPENIELNRSSSNFDILQHASLFICQGGQGSVLEALYRGVPLLMMPYTWDENHCRTVSELGLGTLLDPFAVSPDILREHANVLLNDRDTQVRVREAQESMRRDRGAEIAADILGTYVRTGA